MNGSASPSGIQKPRIMLLRFFGGGLVFAVCLGLAGFFYVKTHPLVFNESFLGHALCIAAAGLTLVTYAKVHEGRFPFHTNGFGDALVSLLRSTGESSTSIITGANDDGGVFRDALANGTHVPQELCSRIYVQGLSETNGARIAILFDKEPSPGGDHCHGLRRIFAPSTREAAFTDGSHETVLETAWPQFAASQIDLLIAAGLTRSNAEAIYAPTLKLAVKSAIP